MAPSLESKGKKLGKRGLENGLYRESSRIQLQTKKVGGMAGREERGGEAKQVCFYTVKRRTLRKLRNRNIDEGVKECQLDWKTILEAINELLICSAWIWQVTCPACPA